MVVKEVLRLVATEVGVDLLNPRGGLKNTEQLGADVIRALLLRSMHQTDRDNPSGSLAFGAGE